MFKREWTKLKKCQQQKPNKTPAQSYCLFKWTLEMVALYLYLLRIPISCCEGSSYSSWGPATIRQLCTIKNITLQNVTFHNTLSVCPQATILPHIYNTKPMCMCVCRVRVLACVCVFVCLCLCLCSPWCSIRCIYICFFLSDSTACIS